MKADPAAERARHERASEILVGVRELRGTERAVALREACGSDGALLALVESLAAHVDDAPGGLHTGAVQAAVASLAEHVASLHDAMPAFSRIGRYRIVGVLGTGGMGEVLEAQQDRPKRHVAVKVLRSGLASREVVARFEREAQVLGQLQHPGIAQIFEAGIADSEPAVAGGVAFIAMELVRGVSLTEHASRESLSTAARLELLARTCDAVHHAHLRGFVHRDLKPSNVLVDEHGQPKVLDFGVARASGSDVTVATLHTTVGQLIGTVPYMSPEQASGDVASVDARSDVHALGVVGCELLTGRLPRDLRGLPVPEALRRIRDDEPTRAGSIDRRLRGDVETILAKALERDPARRYQSAAEMASDIRRHLASEPILARPPSTTYQLARFARRNRVLVVGIVIAFLALVAGTLLLDRARRREMVQRQAAETSAHEASEGRRAALEQAYLASLTAGITALEAENVRGARLRLDAAPASLRGWEWHHARARCDESSAQLPLPLRTGVRLGWRDDGRLTAVRVNWLGISVVRTYDASGAFVECGIEAGAEVTVDPACMPAAAWTAQLPAGADALRFRDPAGAVLATIPRPAGVDGVVRTLSIPGSPDLLWQQARGRFGWIALGSTAWTIAEVPGVNDGSTWARRVDPARRRILIDLSDTGRAQVLDLATRRVRATLGRQPEPVMDVAWTSDGRRALTSGRDGSVRAWDPTTGRQLAMVQLGEPLAGIDANDRIIAVGGASGLIRLLDATTLEPKAIRRGSIGTVGALELHDDVLASSADEDDVVRTWSISLEDPRLLARHDSYAYDVAIVPRTGAVVSCGWDGTLRMTAAFSGLSIAIGRSSSKPVVEWMSLAPSPDGSRIAAVGTKHLVLFDAASGGEIAAPVPDDNWWHVAWLRGGRDLACGTPAGLVVAFDASTWRESARWHATRELTDPTILEVIAASHDGSTLAAGLRSGAVALLDAAGLRERVRSRLPNDGEISALAWDPDDARIVAGNKAGIVEVLDARSGSWADSRLALESAIYDIAFSPDATRLAVALEDGTFSIVSWPQLTEMARFRAHERYVHAVAWLPDGSGIVTASGDGTVRSWTTWRLADQLAERARDQAAAAR